MIIYVWAEDKKGQIGYQGHLPWHLPADLQHFKKITLGHPIIMGRKTFMSFPKLLPKRKHIVLTHDKTLQQKYANNSQVVILTSLKALQEYLDQHHQEQLCAIGGVSIFKALLNQVDRLEETKIDHVFQADTRMPVIDYDQFRLIKKEPHQPDAKNKYPYTFLTYERKLK